MISISMSDILVAPELAGHNEFNLLPVEMDDITLPLLYQLGLDINDGYCIVASKHRNLQNQVVVGYRYVGEIRKDREFKHSPFCSALDRIVAAGDDVSLKLEMANMLGTTLNYNSFSDEEDDKEATEGLLNDYLQEDYEEVSEQIKTLQKLCDDIRGNPLSSDGMLKNRQEWKLG